MPKPRPPIDSVLQVIGGATPLLKELEAAKKNLDGYVTTVETYQKLVAGEQANIAAIMLRLQKFADDFVALYTSIPEEPEPEPTPEPTEETPEV